MEGLAVEFIDACPVLADRDGDGPGKTELGVYMGYRFQFPLDRVAERLDGKITHLRCDLFDILFSHALAIEIEGTIGHRPGEPATGMNLDARIYHFPFFAQRFGYSTEVILIFEGEGLYESAWAIENGSGTNERLFCEGRG